MTIALVTGGSRGLGKSMCVHLAAKGHDIILTYHTNRAEADDTVAQIERAGRKAVALQLDVSDSSTFAAFGDGVRKALTDTWQLERFDYLVNNAGIGTWTPFTDVTEEQFDRLMNIHFKGTFFLTQRLLPLMNDGGRILNISSGLARFSLPGYSAYASMKGGVEVLTRYLALELAPRKIAVNVLAPGAIATDFGGGTVRDNPEVNATIASQTSLGRVGLPDDIGGAVAAILSDDCRWLNGQRIEFSGGIHL
ncbi:SDR family oxidoreductase [Geomonas sp. Red32]|uniref:SDR family NAD(P)-dependent oxidoreductase n=1 Tax=Geomonas sp. Red32 TaxID=2912856 RepID=UPI00202CEA11|nr:SDR family oxidoreductase [Geomonas sp. Red32]MCM0082076.1 SDR family oxidoreductase [Geomonas sp. Red32]